VVFLVALNFYTDLSNASVRASNHTREIRRATAILDRVARDFEGAFLIVKPPEVDPIAHPWLFVAEGQLASEGADHVKFVTRNHDPSRTEAPESDLAMVAYLVDRDADGQLALYRWSLPHLPESLDRSFPAIDDERTYLLAEDIGSFALHFIDETGAVADAWDSTTLVQSSTLPYAVEIEVSMAREEVPFDPDAIEQDEAQVYRRKVVIQVRPLDLAALLTPGGGGTGEGGEDQDGEDDGDVGSNLTIGQCLDISGGEIPDECGPLVSLVSSQPDLAFDPADVAQLPASCQALVSSNCR
jgi:hypothetical protein